ncbi:MAG: hydantoinase B/oxoprolinase family protein, partial [Rhizobiales bacterium]|nr:hydantoinase B/oxoprolinase family protein [Hyphomicrobiales bacterium]
TLRHEQAGGGGYGDPLRRPFAAILRDIADGKLTRQRAAADYALVFNPAGGIDESATATLRAARRA